MILVYRNWRYRSNCEIQGSNCLSDRNRVLRILAKTKKENKDTILPLFSIFCLSRDCMSKRCSHLSTKKRSTYGYALSDVFWLEINTLCSNWIKLTYILQFTEYKVYLKAALNYKRVLHLNSRTWIVSI